MIRHARLVPALGVAGAVLLAVTPASAQEGREPPKPTDYRHELMEGMQTHQGALRFLLDGLVTHPDHVLGHAQAIRSLARMLTDVWPEGSAEGTRAKPGIWANWDDFAAKLSALQEAADGLVTAAESGDAEAVGEAAGTVQRSCRACHSEYRARAN